MYESYARPTHTVPLSLAVRYLDCGQAPGLLLLALLLPPGGLLLGGERGASAGGAGARGRRRRHRWGRGGVRVGDLGRGDGLLRRLLHLQGGVGGRVGQDGLDLRRHGDRLGLCGGGRRAARHWDVGLGIGVPVQVLLRLGVVEVLEVDPVTNKNFKVSIFVSFD